MEERIQLSEMELNNLMSKDEEFKNLYYTSPLFNSIIQQFTIGLNKENLITILKALCINNDEIMKKLMEIEVRYVQYKL